MTHTPPARTRWTNKKKSKRVLKAHTPSNNYAALNTILEHKDSEHAPTSERICGGTPSISPKRNQASNEQDQVHGERPENQVEASVTKVMPQVNSMDTQGESGLNTDEPKGEHGHVSSSSFTSPGKDKNPQLP